MFDVIDKELSTMNYFLTTKLATLKEAIAQKLLALASRKGIAFHQENARTHTSIEARQKLRELGLKVLMYSPM